MPDCKEQTVYRFSGSMLSQGRFKDSKGVDYDLNPDLVRKLYGNIKANIPIVIDHVDGDNVASTFKVTMLPDASDILYEALVFSEAGINAIKSGKDNISPDIEFELDEDDNIVNGYIQRLALVKESGIDGTGIRWIHAAFSKYQGDNMVDGTTQTNNANDSSTTTPPANPPENKTPPVDQSTDSSSQDGGSADEMSMADLIAGYKEITNKYNELSDKYTNLENAHKSLSTKQSAADAAQFNLLSTEATKLGIDVKGILKGVPEANRIPILSSIVMASKGQQNSLLGNTSNVGDSRSTPEQQQKEKAQQEAFARLGLDKATYLEMTGKNKKGE